VLTLAGCGGNGPDEAAPTTSTSTTTTTAAASGRTLADDAALVRRQLRGIPQHGLVLGSRKAPVTIVEYGTFACPRCAALHRDVLPGVIDRYVRTGQASLEFRPLAGDEPSPSRDLALASHAASAQGRGWEFVQLAYRRGLESPASGTPTESPARLAGALGLDVQRLEKDARRPAAETQVEAAQNVAAAARMSTYPVFLLRARSRPEEPFVVLSGPGSVGSFDDALERARKGSG
jgi:protein-disulfide isomerase